MLRYIQLHIYQRIFFLACLPTQKKPHMNYSCPDMFNISYSKSHLKCCSSSKESSTLLQTVAKVQIQINSYYYFSKLQLEKEKFCDLNFSYLILDDCVPNETQCLKSSQKMVRWSLWNIFPDITRICKCSFWRLFQLWTPIFSKIELALFSIFSILRHWPFSNIVLC